MWSNITQAFAHPMYSRLQICRNAIPVSPPQQPRPCSFHPAPSASSIENQLVAWDELYRAGKKLRLNLSFNYVDASQSPTTSVGWTDRRGFSSTTRQMLAEGAAQLDAEQVSSTHLFGRRYTVLCVVLAIHVIWDLTAGATLLVKKHYKLHTHYLKSLILHVQDGHSLRTHYNVPKDIRKQLYAEEQLSL